MKTHMAAAWLALSATSAQAAADSAPTPCLTSLEAQALVTVLAPPAIQGFTRACNGALPANAYLRVNADRLIKRYEAAAVTARPAASSAAGKIGGTGKTASPEMFDAFAGMIVAELVTKDIKPDVCVKVDRVAALLDPLPAANLAGVVAAIFEFASEDKKHPAPFKICKA